jgi:membrane-bound serine protease (ClpP class)
MVGSFISGDLQTQEGQVQLFTGLGAVLGGCLVAIIGAWIVANRLGDSIAMRRIILEDEITIPSSHNMQSQPLLQTTAVAVTDLRPSGRIEVNGEVFDATSSGQWIAKGAYVRIIQLGLTIEVEELSA